MRLLRIPTLRSDSRASALWGTGNRGGEHRSSALWGSGGRGGERRVAVTLFAVFALAIPTAAAAGSASKGSGSGKEKKSYIDGGLLKKAKENPNEKVRVIVQSVAGADEAGNVAKGKGNGQIKRQLKSAGGVAVEMTAERAAKLAEDDGLTITPDYKVRLFDLGSEQLWPYAQNFDDLWSKDAVTCETDALGLLLDPTCVASAAVFAPTPPAIAIVDSGIDKDRLDFAGRVVAETVLVSGTGVNSPGDGRGHGTFVAGIAAGSAPGYAGAAPNAPLVSVDVMDDSGMAYVSDVVAGIDWIIANKAAHNIRVASFSLGAPAASIKYSPLNDAVEKLWFSGVVVVASGGNYGIDGQPTGVRTAPANDPFVITVGATDVAADVGVGDDYVAPWSVWGHTADGFAKPDLSASGRYMIGPVPATATLASERPDNVVAPGYMRLSGTSFSAPAVSAAAAQVLARHPDWTPDQVKGALMLTARAMPLVANRAGGLGELDAGAASAVTAPPNPNAGLNQFVVADPAGGSVPVFDEAAWAEAAHANAAWNEAAWAEAAWAEAAWAEAAWAEAAWAEAAWAEAAWAEAAWAEAAWGEAAWAEAGWSEAAWSEAAWAEAAWTEAAWTDSAASE
jgi:serine protease AprX